MPVLRLEVLLQTKDLPQEPGGRRWRENPCHVQLCKSFPDHVECHVYIVKELKERDEVDKIQDRETVKGTQVGFPPLNTEDI